MGSWRCVTCQLAECDVCYALHEGTTIPNFLSSSKLRHGRSRSFAGQCCRAPARDCARCHPTPPAVKQAWADCGAVTSPSGEGRCAEIMQKNLRYWPWVGRKTGVLVLILTSALPPRLSPDSPIDCSTSPWFGRLSSCAVFAFILPACLPRSLAIAMHRSAELHHFSSTNFKALPRRSINTRRHGLCL